jgi:hypothetical protein
MFDEIYVADLEKGLDECEEYIAVLTAALESAIYSLEVTSLYSSPYGTGDIPDLKEVIALNPRGKYEGSKTVDDIIAQLRQNKR